jgi:hypothetical protein
MTKILSASWWKAAAIRALRTALVVAVPYVPISFLGDVSYITLASAAALAGILSLFTSFAGIAEVEGEVQPWYFAILSRVVKTVAQAAVAGVGTAVLFSGVDWASIGSMALTAGFGSLLLAVIGQLPEADKATAVVTLPADLMIVNTSEPVVLVADVEDSSVEAEQSGKY